MSTSTRSVNSEMFLFFVTLPHTGLAQRHCISDSVFLPSSDLSWKADMFRKIKIRKMTLNRALDKYLKTVSI
ncbi:TPA: hypothetical protein ACIYDL_005654, partial [Escherichia coli]